MWWRIFSFRSASCLVTRGSRTSWAASMIPNGCSMSTRGGGRLLDRRDHERGATAFPGVHVVRDRPVPAEPAWNEVARVGRRIVDVAGEHHPTGGRSDL